MRPWPREGRKDHACDGVAWPVGGLKYLDPVAPDISGEPQHACCGGGQAASEAGELLKFGAPPQRWAKVRRTQRDTMSQLCFNWVLDYVSMRLLSLTQFIWRPSILQLCCSGTTESIHVVMSLYLMSVYSITRSQLC